MAARALRSARLRLGLAVGAGVLLSAGWLVSVASAASFPVTSTANAGVGSLRQAILDANANGGADVVPFQIPGSGVRTIVVTSGPLPAVTDSVTIDATSQPGYAGFPLVRLDNGTGNPIVGLDVTAGSSQVGGLRITRFGVGVRLATAGANVVAANWIGLVSATASAGNGTGVLIEDGSNGNTVGGTSVAARNLISGNTVSGVTISGTTDNVIAGNRVGTNAAGTGALANGTGVTIGSDASGNTIGGTSPAARNLISGNTLYGVSIRDLATTANTIAGNYIGTNAAGTAALANGRGVRIGLGANGNTVGGTSVGARNLISGNGLAGVLMSEAGTTGNVVAGNFIGTNPAGSAALANLAGVRIQAGASGNTVGGTVVGARNVISGNYSGVEIAHSGTTGNTVVGNFIGTTASAGGALANVTGVVIEEGASGNTVGGTSVGARNLISGNSSGGVDIRGSDTTGNVVAGNRIGTNLAGTSALPNVSGVIVQASASGNTIGGTTVGARNVISGNTSYGVDIHVAPSNVVAGNRIGTNAAATAALANGTGVHVGAFATGNTVGGTMVAARNLISGNTIYGVEIAGQSATGNTVAGNYIGTNAAGTVALANATGLRLSPGAAANTVGGTTAGARNLISGNTGPGVHLRGSASAFTSGNVVAGNYIGVNATASGALANNVGVLVEDHAPGNTVGGTSVGARNLISGNTTYGVRVFFANDNVIAGNYIGTNATASAALGNNDGVFVDNTANGNTIGGTSAGARNVISGNTNSGVLIRQGPSNTSIAGNYIGTNAAGTAAVPNYTGVSVESFGNGNTIGGTTASARNVISGNTSSGVTINGFGTTGNVVAGNRIGTNATGAAPLPNEIGVLVLNRASGNTVGGTTAAARNLISGNASYGVVVAGTGTTGNTVSGNFVGTSAAGVTAVPNGTGVVVADAASGNTVGGTTSGARNVISGNPVYGVAILGAGTTGNVVAGNRIGTNAPATGALANGTGVLVGGGASFNTVGGTEPGAGNTIAFNDGAGVSVDGSLAATTGNSIEANSIDSNGGLGIELLFGANDGQAAPLITSVLTGVTTTIEGTLASLPSTDFRIELFGSPGCDPSGAGEGNRFYGFTNVTTDSGGSASFSFMTALPLAPGQAVTATATNVASGSTSAFSFCFFSP